MISGKEFFTKIRIDKSPSLNRLLNVLKEKGFEYEIVSELHDYQLLLSKDGKPFCGCGTPSARKSVIYNFKMLDKMGKL